MKNLSVFKAANGAKTSSKRTAGLIILAVTMGLWLDAHFSTRVLNQTAFSAALTSGVALLVGGVLEGKFTTNERSSRRTRYYRREEKDKHPLE